VFPSQAVPIRHRAAMCEIAVSGSSWLAVGRWEATRRRVMPYNSVLQHVQQLLNNAFGGAAKPLVDAVADDMLADLAGHPGVPLGTSPPPTHRDRGSFPASRAGAAAGGGVSSRARSGFPSPQHGAASVGSGGAMMSLSSSPQGKTPSHLVPRVMYLCGADHLLQAGPQTLRTFGCICCARPGFTDELRSVVGRRYRRLVHVVDDNALLPTSLDSLSSTKVRRRMMAGKEVNSLVGEAVGRYIRATGIANKVSGQDAWTETDKEGITYNAAVAVRAAALKDHAGALISAHKQHEREHSMKRRGAGAAATGMQSSRRHGQSASQASLPRAAAPARGLKVSPLLLPRTDPDSKRSARHGGGRVCGVGTKHLSRAGQAVMSSDSLPEFALPTSHGGPALGGGRGRRHWPGGQPRRSGAVPPRNVLGGGAASSAAGSRGTRAPSAAGRVVTRGQRLAPSANRRAWSGGPRLIG
jgi:nicotinic acid mononucleotide adenylyltransferase